MAAAGSGAGVASVAGGATGAGGASGAVDGKVFASVNACRC